MNVIRGDRHQLKQCYKVYRVYKVNNFALVITEKNEQRH